VNHLLRYPASEENSAAKVSTTNAPDYSYIIEIHSRVSFWAMHFEAHYFLRTRWSLEKSCTNKDLARYGRDVGACRAKFQCLHSSISRGSFFVLFESPKICD